MSRALLRRSCHDREFCFANRQISYQERNELRDNKWEVKGARGTFKGTRLLHRDNRRSRTMCVSSIKGKEEGTLLTMRKGNKHPPRIPFR